MLKTEQIAKKNENVSKIMVNEQFFLTIGSRHERGRIKKCLRRLRRDERMQKMNNNKMNSKPTAPVVRFCFLSYFNLENKSSSSTKRINVAVEEGSINDGYLLCICAIRI